MTELNKKYIKWGIMAFLIGFALSYAANIFASTITHSAVIQDHYREVVYLEPYSVEVCQNQQVSVGNADIANSAFWGAIFGAVVGDVIDEDNGKVPGAVIGGMLGAKDAEGKMTKTLATVCKTETRKKSTSVNEYSHSTITFEYDGIMYELDFIKRQ